MLTEQGPQHNCLDPKCTDDLLILYILSPTPLTGCQFGIAEYDGFLFKGAIVKQTVKFIRHNHSRGELGA